MPGVLKEIISLMFEIVDQPIDVPSVLRSVAARSNGATVLFLGTTRQFTCGKETIQLEYECYPAMALQKMQALGHRALEKWPIEGCAIVHRIGLVPVGETSVAIAVSTPHRVAAFEAAEWIIDTLKREVPIWKKEMYADGQQEWIHPTDNAPTP